MNSTGPSEAYFPARAAFAKLVSLITFLLIFVGGVVTSHNAGLSVPDWPTSFGYHMWNMPFSMWKGGVFYEHSHRVLASIVGLLVLLQAIWLGLEDRRRWLRVLGLACLGLVLLQGLLGGLTVLHALPTPVSVAHGVLAQLFFCITLVVAYGLSRERVTRLAAGDTRAAPGPVRTGVFAMMALVAVQLVLAAYMRHDLKFQGGVAIPDFPKTAGSWLPWVTPETIPWIQSWRAEAVSEHGAAFELTRPVQSYQAVVHLAHRAMALVLLAAAAWFTCAARRLLPAGHRARPLVGLLDALLLAQVVLGAIVVWSNKGPLLTSLHVVTGAAILGCTVLLALRVCPARWALPSTPSTP